jgi:4-amino-4-deoxy-L-arabinose transferase-like glycosyltransferase
MALVFLALTAREIHSRHHGWTAVLIMLGCLGLQVRAHQLITDVGLLAGISMGIYGLASGRHFSIRSGIALGAGTAIAFLCKGLLGPGMLWVAASLLPLSREWRQRNYFATLSIAAVVAIPGIAAWTIALYLRSPDLFATWLITNNFDRFLGLTDIGPHQPRFFYAYTLLWYAFPALPLASWTAWSAWREHHGGWAEPRLLLPIALLLVMLAVLGLAADARELYLMPVLLPLALLATAGMDRIPSGAGIALARFGTGALGISALGLWLGWLALVTGEPSILAKTLAEHQPGYVAQFAWPAVSMAMLATVARLVLAFPRAVTAQQGITQWTAGITLCVVLVGTLWLSYLNSGKSYHDMIQSMLESIPGESCVASRYLGEPQRALLRYYGNLLTVREEVDHAAPCDLLLVQGWRSSGAPAQSPEWAPVWEGARAGDNREFYRLYVRNASAASPIKQFPDARPVLSSTAGANTAQ